MKVTIARTGTGETTKFACSELVRYLRRMDESLSVEERTYRKHSGVPGVLWIGLNGLVQSSEEDEILISVDRGSGIITGSNERALLIAVYRFLRELGCDWLFPGPDGEVVPQKKLIPQAICVNISEKAAYHHRAICTEGSMSYEHLFNMIDWIPKAGMNGYYAQFYAPLVFLQRWYRDEQQKVTGSAELDDKDAYLALWQRAVEEIEKRSLLYYAGGHGFTLEPFGIHDLEWYVDYSECPEKVPGTIKPYLAMINGERKVFNKKLSNTNLCYSNPLVRETIIDGIIDFCKERPSLDYAAVALADNFNNHCECEECQKMTPSDYLILMLNELDRKMTEQGIQTRVMFSLYCELLWAATQVKIENPDRILFKFCPISRKYDTLLTDLEEGISPEPKPYIRNKISLPYTVAENVNMLKGWQKTAPCESLVFDYHLHSAQYRDPGFYQISQVLHDDMAKLDRLGLNGMVSCQAQRASFPVGLPMYAMAKALWNKNSVFEDVSKTYFAKTFGELGAEVEDYLRTLSELFDAEYINGKKQVHAKKDIARYERLIRVIEDFDKRRIEPNKARSIHWEYLSYHAELCLIFAELIKRHIMQDKDGCRAYTEKLHSRSYQLQPHIHRVFDVQLFNSLFELYLKRVDIKVAEGSDAEMDVVAGF